MPPCKQPGDCYPKDSVGARQIPVTVNNVILKLPEETWFLYSANIGTGGRKMGSDKVRRKETEQRSDKLSLCEIEQR